MTHQIPFIAQRLLNTPIAIHPNKIEFIISSVAHHFGLRLRGADAAISLHMDDDGIKRAPYEVKDGVAIIPVCGTLVAKLGCRIPICGMTGYDGLRLNFIDAIQDQSIKAIAFDIDSGGGEVSGCFDFVDLIYAARGTKPVWAILNDSAYSAAYAIASACDVITVPRTGGTGSVGVVTMHCDLSKALDQQGVGITFIYYGDHKTDGNETQPLAPDARVKLQHDVDVMGDLFTSTVARNRSMSQQRVIDTQATTFLGAEGVDVGFADVVMARDHALRVLINGVSD